MTSVDGELIDPIGSLPTSDDKYGAKVLRFILSSIGGPLGAVASAWSEAEQAHAFDKLAAILQMEAEKVREMYETLLEIEARIDQTDERIKQRMESPEYLSLVKKCFRDWSAAESREKRT